MAPSWQRRFFAPARVPKFLRDDAQLTDRHLAMYLQHHEERRDAPLRGFRHEEAEAISASGLSSLSDSSDSTSPSRLQRHIFGARGQRPSLGGAGCFAAMVGGCGGCLVWSLGCHIVFLCVAAGAFAEQTVRHAQWRQRQRAYMSSSSEEDGDSSEDDSNANGLDQDTIELTTVVSTVNARSISQLLGRQSSDSEHCQCMICVEHFQKGDSIRTLPCLHRYHKKCIDEWLRRSCTCPICKHDVTETDFHMSAFASAAHHASAASQQPRYRRLYSGGLAQVARLRRSVRRSIDRGTASTSLAMPRFSAGRAYT